MNTVKNTNKGNIYVARLKKMNMKRTCSFAAVAMLLMACASGGKSEHMRVAPLDSGLNIDSLSNCTVAVGFSAADIDWNDGRMTCSVFSKDIYDGSEVKRMRTGDTLVYEGKPMVIVSIEEESNGAKTVNGGIENGGAELVANGDGTYRTMLMDDYSVYTELGKTQLRLDKNFILIDCGIDFHDPSDTIRSNYKEYLDQLPDYRKDNFNCSNTELVIKNGLVTEIHRRWTP